MSTRAAFNRPPFFPAGRYGQHWVASRDYGPAGGTPWLLVHGNSGYLIDPAKMTAFNPEKDRVITLDMRGVGKSLPAGELSENLYPDLAQDIEALRKRMKLPRINILAWSGGVAVAALYARNHPGRVGQLVAYAPFFGSRREIEHMFATYPARGQRWTDFAAFHGTTDTKQLVDLHNKAMLDPARSLDAVKYYCWLADETHADFAAFEKSKSPAQWERERQNFRIHANQIARDYGLRPGEVAKAMDAAAHKIDLTLILPEADAILSASLPRSLHHLNKNIKLTVAAGASHDIHDPAAQTVLARILHKDQCVKPGIAEPKI